MKAIAENVTATLYDLTDFERKKLDALFAVKNPALFFVPQLRRLILSGRMSDKVRFFRQQNNTIPTGLLPKVQNIFPNIQIERKLDDAVWKNWGAAKINAETVEVNGITFRPEQRLAIISAIANMRGILQMATNSGKTPIGAGIISALKLPTLWVIHRKALLSETSERLENYLGIPIGKIGSGNKKTGNLVTVGIDKSIMSMGSKFLEQFECVIFDEAQHLCCKTQQDIAKCCINAPYRIAMSGSFPKDKLKLFQIMSATDATLLYELKNQDLIESGISAKPKVHIRPLRYPATVFGMPLYGFDYPSAQEYCIYDNEFFNCIVIADIESWYEKDKTVLVFAGRKSQGLRVIDKLKEKGISNAFIDSDTPDFVRKEILQKFARKEIAVIVSIQVLTEGIDCPSMGAVLLASGNKSSIEILQKVGRSLRQKKEGENVAIIIDYNFMGNQYTEKHSKMRRKIYVDQGFEITEEKEINLG